METIKKVLRWTIMLITVLIWAIFLGGADSIYDQGLLFPAILAVSFISFICYLTWKGELKEK